MPGEGLSLIVSGEASGVVMYYNMFPNVHIGQAAGAHFRATFPLENAERLLDAYLELGLLLPTRGLGGFALTVNGITITREVKPVNCAPYGDRPFCKMVYDLTPVIRSKKARECVVEIEHRGIGEINVSHIGLVLRIGHESARSRMLYYSGALAIEPGGSSEIRVPENIGPGAELRLVAASPHHAAKLVVEAGGTRLLEAHGPGFSEYTARLPGGASTLRLIHEGTGSYYPSSVVVSSILVYKLEAPKPRIEADASLDRDRARVTIRNTGNAEVRNVIVVSISRGNVLERKIIDALPPSGAATLDIRAERGAVIRIIWRYLDKTMYREIRLR